MSRHHRMRESEGGVSRESGGRSGIVAQIAPSRPRRIMFYSHFADDHESK
jgi:hypothetical protein